VHKENVVKKRKTNRSAAKRFKVTGTGLIVRRHSHARHLLTHKKRKRLRKLTSSALVSKADTARVKKMLNI
jgi:large subunit ribosomal protein L35